MWCRYFEEITTRSGIFALCRINQRVTACCGNIACCEKDRNPCTYARYKDGKLVKCAYTGDPEECQGDEDWCELNFIDRNKVIYD